MTIDHANAKAELQHIWEQAKIAVWRPYWLYDKLELLTKLAYHQLYRQRITNSCQSVAAADHNAVFTRHCSTKVLIRLENLSW